MRKIEEHLRRVAAHPGRYAHPDVPAVPSRHLAILTCMDCRIDLFDLLGLYVGDAHVLRNAGGIVTEDVERSLVLSQHMLGTHDIVILQHTNCGLLVATDEEIDDEIERRTGQRLPWRSRTFTDLDDSVRISVSKLRASPFVDTTGTVLGLVYDTESGVLRPVEQTEIGAEVDV